ncbi:MAG TPA: hypothetical protein DD491_12270 [Halieaceae bacterium]|nr:hypothetical protein [Citromicrobium sp.]HBO13553.1 hypothetical protein [Halieaceae bacterium]
MGQDLSEAIDRLRRFHHHGYSVLDTLTVNANAAIPERRYRGDDLAEVVGLPNVQRIYAEERSGALPSPRDDNGRRLGSTLSEVMGLQAHFGTRPWRHPDDPPAIVAFANQKGGCWKTTTSWWFGSYCAQRGLRVLLVDADPQASLTLNCGHLPDINVHDEDTLGPLLVQGDESGAADLIRPTYLPNMQIIPSCLGLASVEMSMTTELYGADTNREAMDVLLRLQRLLASASADYDVLVVDGTPSLGVLTTNLLLAANLIVTPVPTEITDYASTVAFNELVADQLASVQRLAETLDIDVRSPEIFFLPTRYSQEGTQSLGSQEVLALIQETFGDRALSTPIKKHDAAVSNLTLFRRTAFDVNATNPACGNTARNHAVANFRAVFEEIFERGIAPLWPHGTDFMRATDTRGSKA